MTALDHYGALTRKVDAFFARAIGAAPSGAMQCATGCSDCCLVELTVTRIEAAAIQHLIDARGGKPSPVATEPRCAALGDDDCCAIYAARPVVCRSHGLAIRLADVSSAGGRRLRTLSSCARNFAVETVAPEHVLDQEQLSLTLLAIDRAYADETGGEPGARVSLRSVLASRAR